VGLLVDAGEWVMNQQAFADEDVDSSTTRGVMVATGRAEDGDRREPPAVSPRAVGRRLIYVSK